MILRNMVLNFVGRVQELSELTNRFNSNNFEFVVIYGRRRVGKTTLIKKFIENKDSIYFLCDKAGTARNASRLKRKISEYLNEPPIESNDLYEILENLINKINRRIVIILDEFSYLVEKDDSIPSIFQNIVDESLIDHNCMLILCGSSISMMEMGVLSYKSPLYGRKTAHMKIDILPFVDIQKLFPKNSLEKSIEFFSALGGVPFYLEKFSGNKSTIANIEREIFSKFGGLYEEVEFLLREEFREPAVYRSILAAIASGETRLVDIANKSQMAAHDLPKYLRPLLSLGIIKKEFSILDRNKKKPRYFIKDNYINFWFRFAEPFKSELEINDLAKPLNYLNKNFRSYVGKCFENLIREQFERKIIPFQIYQSGLLWYGDIEIDAVAVDKDLDNAVFIEIKYKKNINPRSQLKLLNDKIKRLPMKPKKQYMFIIGLSFTEKHKNCIMFKDLINSEKK